MSSKFIFSVVIATLNARASLGRCLSSIRKHSDKHIEVVVVDGGSTDGTVDLATSFTDLHLKVVVCFDGGIYGAFNEGVIASSAEWILFLGSDDFLLEDFSPSNFLTALSCYHGSSVLLCCAVSVHDQAGRFLFRKSTSPERFLAGDPLRWSFDHQGVLHSRKFFEKYGMFDRSYSICGDHDLMLRAARRGLLLSAPSFVFAGFSLGGRSSLHSNARLMLAERVRALRINKFRFPARSYVFHFFRSLVSVALAAVLGNSLLSRLSRSFK